KNVAVPYAVTEILKPNDIAISFVNQTNAENTNHEPYTTIGNDQSASEDSEDSEGSEDSEDSEGSEDSNEIDSNDEIRHNVISEVDNERETNKRISRSFASLALSEDTNTLDSPYHQQSRQEIYNKLNHLIINIRLQKRQTKKKEVYEYPPLIKQIIRCLHPSDIDNGNASRKPNVIFTLDTFIEIFRY
ncbi:unnamed protein product, partial [Rotaria magnacalcarata]